MTGGGDAVLVVDGTPYRYTPLPTDAHANRIPLVRRLLLENVLRHRPDDAASARALIFGTDDAFMWHPARLLLQDYSGVPLLVELAAFREALAESGLDPATLDLRLPVDLVVDHSLMADVAGVPGAFAANAARDAARNAERYAFIRWAQQAFANLSVVPPNSGIVHQINLEQLTGVVRINGDTLVPDTVVGTDSHTPMINGAGVLGWGVGGLEALTVAVGRPIWLRVPRTVGVRVHGALRPEATATDLVLTLTERLRDFGVVGTMVEFHGPGIASLGVADRATVANMSPEFGSTCAYFPIDERTLEYLRATRPDPHQAALVQAYARAQGLWHDPFIEREYDATVELDLGEIRPCVAGPRSPQDRRPLAQVPNTLPAVTSWPAASPATDPDAFPVRGAVAIAAITSCTNTANSRLILTAGLLARAARRQGMRVPPWVRTSLAPGSVSVMEYLHRTGLDDDLASLGFHLVGYGCMTCIGNSGPLLPAVAAREDLAERSPVAVLSGNRNFPGRVHADIWGSYLASPPLVVAYALAGTVDLDLDTQALGVTANGAPVYLADLWPEPGEVDRLVAQAHAPDRSRAVVDQARSGDAHWRAVPQATGPTYRWDSSSSYIRRPPYVTDAQVPPQPPIRGARVLVHVEDGVTTDHISPAGSILANSAAGRLLREAGVDPADFNSFGARRTNAEIMLRGVFANSRLHNRLAPEHPGGWTLDHATGLITTVFDAAESSRRRGVDLIVLAGREYGAGSSRDWAAKGPALLGVRCVIAASFERIHRSNLVGMGVLPVQFQPGADARSLGLSGVESFEIELPGPAWRPGGELRVVADGRSFQVVGRLDTEAELALWRAGGVFASILEEARGPEVSRRTAVPAPPRARGAGPLSLRRSARDPVDGQPLSGTVVGGVAELAELIDALTTSDRSPNTALVVSERFGSRASGASVLDELARLRSVVVTIDEVATPAAVSRLSRDLVAADAEVVVAVGGGSVLDTVKAAAGMLGHVIGPTARDVVAACDGPLPATGRRPWLIAIPTTAGTGAEVTPFATIWDWGGGRKLSLAGPEVRPDFALLDADLLREAPPELLANGLLDTVAHSCEAMWSIRNDASAQQWGWRALQVAAPLLTADLGKLARPEAERLMLAGHLSGRAIAAAPTSSCHAVSYPLTVEYGLAHGHACGVTLGRMLQFNAAVGPADCRHPEGPRWVRTRCRQLAAALVGSVDDDIVLDHARRDLDAFMRREDLDILDDLPLDAGRVAGQALSYPRVHDNPRALDRRTLTDLLTST
ncbi:MAG: aconitate hydratase AcnA [Nocardioides sp.]